MKKYLFGMTAIVLAIAFSAFTKPAKVQTPLVEFYYSGNPTIQNDVANEALWVERSSATLDCTGFTEDFACKIVVDEDIIAGSPDPGVRTLANSTSVTIDATQGASSSSYFVPVETSNNLVASIDDGELD